MASDGGLIALTLFLLVALLALLYCLFRQIGPTKQCLRRVYTFFLGPSFLRGNMASSGDEEDEAGYFIDPSSGFGGSFRAGGGGGLFWKGSPSDEERSILGCRRVPSSNNSTVSPETGGSLQKSAYESVKNTYNSADYTHLQEEQMATVTTNSAKLPPPVTNGVSASKNAHTVSAITNNAERQRAKAVPVPPSPNVHTPNIIASNSPEYTYASRPSPKTETAFSPAIPALPPPQQTAASPASSSRRRRQNMQREEKDKRPSEKSAGVEASMLAAINISGEQPTAAGGAIGRPATPDFRFTLAEDDESHRKSDAGKTAATNGNPFRSSSMDSGNAGQLSAEVEAENARRHSLTSMTASNASPALSIDNPSPSGSISDLDPDPESLLVLDESLSGACSRRTSISSVDSNLERLEDSGAPVLMRALSSDSLDSTCSIMELSSNDPEIGQLETRLYYDSSNQYLHVWILQAYDIKPVASSHSGGLVEYWVVVFLLPHQKPLYRTRLLPYAPVLQFHEQFRQRVRDQDLRKLALLCQMYCRIRQPHETQSVSAALAAAGATPPILPSSSSSSSLTPTKKSGTIAGNELIGQAKVRLKDVELSVANTMWLSLLPRLDNAFVDRHLGELLFSLSYLPTAERLTVVVAKARNIRAQDGAIPERIMVRVYLVYGAKISKKKTSVKPTVEGSTSFNESMIFSLSQNLVQKVYLRLSVVEPLSMKSTGEQRTIGHVTIGSRRAGKEFGHWQKMTEHPRKPVSMWHYLAPKSQKLT